MSYEPLEAQKQLVGNNRVHKAKVCECKSSDFIHTCYEGPDRFFPYISHNFIDRNDDKLKAETNLCARSFAMQIAVKKEH